MRNVALAVVVGLVLSFGVANATVPDPDNCTCNPCDAIAGMFVYPDPVPGGLADIALNVRNADNDPIPGAFVEILFGAPANHCFCPDVVLTGTTDAAGNIAFSMSMGGCTEAAGAAVIRANGVPIREYMNVKSADWDGSSNCQVAGTDFTIFKNAYFANPGPGCHDYYNDGNCDGVEFTAFLQAWTHLCP